MFLRYRPLAVFQTRSLIRFRNVFLKYHLHLCAWGTSVFSLHDFHLKLFMHFSSFQCLAHIFYFVILLMIGACHSGRAVYNNNNNNNNNNNVY